MRKFIIFFIILIFICFLAPNLFIVDAIDFNIKSPFKINKNNESGKNIEKTFVLPDIKTIKLLLTEKNEIVELDFDDYIKGVLIGEVPITYEIEALKAQAIVARTYTVYKLQNSPSAHNGADMCDDINCCQCYKTKEYAFASWDDEEENEKWAKLERAVEETKNHYITYDNEIIAAFFHANSGGKTEDVKYVWGEQEIPYLKSVDGNEVNIYEDTKSFTKQEIGELLKDVVPDYLEKDYNIEILNYTDSGRVNNVKIGENTIKATDLRKMLDLRSTNFKVEKNESGDVTFNTIGYGHGVGMSQEGANQMALNGKTAEEIIKHYYTGVEIKTQ